MSTDQMEVRDVHYDYEVELPTGLWHLGYRTLKVRTRARARGYENERGRFVVTAIMSTISHEVERDGGALLDPPWDGKRREQPGVALGSTGQGVNL